MPRWLGRAIATALDRQGARLLLVDIDADGLADIASLLEAEALVADVADASGRASIAERCGGGGPDILINNAGIEKASEYAPRPG